MKKYRRSMKKYTVYATWSVSGEVTVEAENPEDAIERADAEPLPTETNYVDGSWVADAVIDEHGKQVYTES